MKRLYSTLCLVLLSIISFAQSETGAGSINGTITTRDNKGAALVTVRVKGIKKATLSNNEGRFTIENIQAGSYSLEISSIGFEAIEKEVTVSANNTTDVYIQLSEAQTQLSEVIVSAGRIRETIDEVPSSVSIVGLKTLQQNINITTNLGDILENRVPGLAPSTGLSSNFGQTLRGRSLLIMVDGVPQSTPLRNGAMDLRALDPAVIERIEVVKGATAIYGNGAAGGLINYFTRDPRTTNL